MERIIFNGTNYEEVIEFLNQRKIKTTKQKEKLRIDSFKEDIYITIDDVVWFEDNELLIRSKESIKLKNIS